MFYEFRIFRYQILPIDRFEKNSWELIKQKNFIFKEILDQIFIKEQIVKRSFEDDRYIYDYPLYYDYSKFKSFLEIVKNHNIFSIEKIFQKDQKYLCDLKLLLEPRENITFKVFIWNDPEYQYFVIQEREEFNGPYGYNKITDAIIFEISIVINQLLRKHHLCAYFNPLLDKEKFWKIVQDNYRFINKIYFDLITPNMSNISKSLSEDLKRLGKESNSKKIGVDLDAGYDSQLRLDNPNVGQLVDYASKGGGTIHLKDYHYEEIKTIDQCKKSIVIGDLEMSLPPDKIVETMEILLHEK